MLLWFQTDAFDAAVERVRTLGAEVLEEPHVNTNANHRECWLRDPDGYVVVLAGAYGDVGGSAYSRRTTTNDSSTNQSPP